MDSVVSLRIEADFDFSMKEFFPDGVPKNVTFDEIVEVVKQQRNIIDDWCLPLALTVSYTYDNPHYDGDHVLFDEHRPQKRLTEQETIVL